MNDWHWQTFPNYGYIDTRFTDEELLPVRQEINKIKDNFLSFDSRKYQHRLAGNIAQEFSLEESHDYLENLILPYTKKYDEVFNFNSRICSSMLEDDTRQNELYLYKVWVNFQQKNEFNPIHNHIGVLSFVIWIEVPYLIENEHMHPSVRNSNTAAAGSFDFVYSDTTGNINSSKLIVSKETVNTMILFPSNFSHQVYPFYTSDDYRISISGNFKIKR